MTTPRPLTALDDALAALRATLAPVTPREVACAQAVGCIAASDVRATTAQPPRAIALRAGYALRAEDLAGASGFSPAFLSAAPQAVEIGDALPDGCDCVLEAASLDLSGPAPQALAESWPGENIRRTGEDFAQGALLIAAGKVITPRDALLAAQAGVAMMPVRVPQVAFIGDGQLGAFIAHYLKSCGADVTRDHADLVVAIGDAPQGAVIDIPHLALEPGRDCALGRLGAAPLILLPRQPDQALAGVFALVRPALDALSARAPSHSNLELAAKIASRVGVAEVVLLGVDGDQFTPLAVGDFPLQSLLRATHVALMPAQSEGCAAGALFAADSLDA